MHPIKILGIYGSPRKSGNTELLLKELLIGCREIGAEVKEIYLRDLKITPCLEIHACRVDGKCPIQDDMQPLYHELVNTDALVLASPVFFYSVSAQVKAMIDRCQALWARKYILQQPIKPGYQERRGIFLSVGGSNGNKIFDGALLTMKYFFDSLDMKLYRSLLFKGIDAKGEIRKHPSALAEAFALGKELAGERDY